MALKLPTDVKQKLDTTIRHVQQEERGAALESARQLGQMLAQLPLSLDKHTGIGPSQAIEGAWSQLSSVMAALIDAGGQGGPMATRVMAFFDDAIRNNATNPAIVNYNKMMMRDARG
jgi:hypothetical protein